MSNTACIFFKNQAVFYKGFAKKENYIRHHVKF